jgi:hypothetical protein
MPLELGIFLGARRFGAQDQRRKSCLILDRTPYRYQIFCSDISGQEVRPHHNQGDLALRAVRNWLQASLPAGRGLPGASAAVTRYAHFRLELPFMCREKSLGVSDLTFLDYRQLVEAWIEVFPS